nr:MAG TPA: hypothetical protein [Caudoviricetes sp.]
MRGKLLTTADYHTQVIITILSNIGDERGQTFTLYPNHPK